VESHKIRSAVVQKAANNPKLKTATLLDEFAAKTEDPSFRTRTGTTKSLARNIQKAKAKALFKPAAPKTFDDLATIPDDFTVIYRRPNFQTNIDNSRIFADNVC
jgi:hypothetical protein